MSLDDFIPLLTLLTSLVPAAIIFLRPEERTRERTVVNMAGATVKLGLIGVMLWGVFHHHQYEFRFPVLPTIDFVLRADALAMFFLTLSGLLWFITTIYAIAYLEGSPHRSRFFGFFSLCVCATAGIALSGNLFTFIIFYELLTLSTYPLVVHRETEVSRRAGRDYLAYTLPGGALLLGGAAWLHTLVPTVDFAAGRSLGELGSEHRATLRVIFWLLITGVGVKAAFVPLHGWLAKAMVAPAPVSALLHAVAVVKAGAFGVIRIVYDIYGIDRAHELGVMLPLAIWASVTIVYGSVRALLQDDLKRRLAFSTVSQVSYIVLGVGLIGPSSTIGGVVHLVHQGLMKITLFFCAGNLSETLGIKKISEMHGVGRRMPWTMAAFTLGALGMIGVPPLCGFVSKWYLGAGAIEASQHWVLVILAVSSALNAAYFLPMIFLAWFRERRGDWPHESIRGRVETAWGLLLPPVATSVFALGVGLLAGAPFSPMQWATLIAERAYGRIAIDWGIGGDFRLCASNIGLLLALATPLAIACFLLSRRLPRGVLSLASLAALPAVTLSYFAEPGTTVDLPWLLFHMHLGVDATSQLFLRFTALLWLLAGIYARGYFRDDPRASVFFFYFLLAMAGNFGLILSKDMTSFYVFFALMSFASYPLVIYNGDAEALFAGRVYIVLVVFGEVVLLSGILLTTVTQESLLLGNAAVSYSAAPRGQVICILILIGFGIKAGLFPLHVWLPLAHPAAPTPASAVLSGVMIKAGLLGWLRFLPLGQTAFPTFGKLCLIAGLFTAFYGAIVGVTQRNAKAVLAYSSISQMGLITLGIGGGLLVPAGWSAISSAVLIFALHHGLSKGCLFLSVGIAPVAAGGGWRARLLQLGLAAPALALAGAPLTMGAVSKTALMDSLAALPDDWTKVLGVLLPLASIGTTLLMARFLFLIWPRSESDAKSPAATVLISWFVLLIMVMGALWILPIGYRPDDGLKALVETVKWKNLWPVLVGVVTAYLAWRIDSRRESSILPAIPRGDILAVWKQMPRALGSCWEFVTKMPAFPYIWRTHEILRPSECRRIIQSVESDMQNWAWIAMSVLATAGACYVWLFFG